MKTTIFALAFGFLSVASANAGTLTCHGQRTLIPDTAPEQITVTIEKGEPDGQAGDPIFVSVMSDISTFPLADRAAGRSYGNFGEGDVRFIFTGGSIVLAVGNSGITGRNPSLMGDLILTDEDAIPLYCPVSRN